MQKLQQHFHLHIGSNRTFMELKSGRIPAPVAHVRSNRTFMELKCLYTRLLPALAYIVLIVPLWN